jgi:hypothetical protein
MRDRAVSWAHSRRSLIAEDKFDPRPAHVGFVVEIVALGYVLVQALWFYPLRDAQTLSTRCGTPEVPSYPVHWSKSGSSVSGGHKYRLVLQVSDGARGWSHAVKHHMSRNQKNTRPRTNIGVLRHTSHHDIGFNLSVLFYHVSYSLLHLTPTVYNLCKAQRR